MMSEKENVMDLKKYVDDKIKKFTFHAKNFDKGEMDRVDAYCKKYYGNDRKKMILTLISLVEHNLLYTVLNDKIDLLTERVIAELDKVYKLAKLNESEKPKSKKVHWKGFSKEE